MATLTYWLAYCTFDHDRYSLRARTKRECMEMVRDYRRRTPIDEGDQVRFAPPIKIVETYTDAFDLISRALGEEGIEGGFWNSDYEEDQAAQRRGGSNDN